MKQIGMNRNSAGQRSVVDHVKQSIQDILTTPIGTRVKRRQYGSHLFGLIDSTMNPAGQLRLTAAAVDAISKWEPRVVVNSARVRVDSEGIVVLDIDYQVNSLSQVQSQKIAIS